MYHSNMSFAKIIRNNWLRYITVFELNLKNSTAANFFHILPLIPGLNMASILIQNFSHLAVSRLQNWLQRSALEIT